jgi:hypothetical protein
MADIRPDLNVFEQAPTVGQVAMISGAGPETISVMVDLNSTVIAGDLKPGMAVELVDGTSTIPEVDLSTIPETSSDNILGIVVHNPKVSSYIAGDILQVALTGAVIYMIAGASLNRGVKVGLENPVSHSGISRVIAATNDPDMIGTLLDKCAEDDLVRVQLDLKRKLPA